MLVRRVTFRTFVLSTCAAVALAAGVPAAALADAPPSAVQSVRFNIPAQSLTTALSEFARQSGRQLLFAPEIAANKSANAVTGTFDPLVALDRLIAGTGLTYDLTSSGAILVRAQARAAAGTPSPAAEPPASGDTAESESAPVESVTVTGTSIRGIRNPTSPVQSYDRDTIDRSGYTNTQQFIRALPQNYGGGQNGASEDGKIGPGSLAQVNNEAASGVNLRGLGNSSTLVLLNGRRMAPSAFGAIVDVSAIPISAIQRVDVLTDGASAIYGADAVAGVVNFILRKDYEGAETSLLYGSVTDGSMDEHIVGQTFGHSWETGSAMAALQYHDRGHLPASERSFTDNALQPTDIIPGFVKYSGIFTAHQQIGDDVELFADALLSRNNVSRKDNRPGQMSSTFSDNEGTNLTGGIAYEPFGDWRVEASGTYSQQRLRFGFYDVVPNIGYPIGAPALHNNEVTTSADLRADGSLFSIPGGDVKLAVGASYRDEDFSSDALAPSPLLRTFHRNVSAVYGEAYVPIVGEANALPFVERLDLSAAVRYDSYSDFGDTTNPKIGLLWTPTRDLDLRASWGTSFRAPSAQELLNQHLFGGVSLFNYLFVDPSGVGVVPVLVEQGTSQNLLPEKSDNWSVGFDYKPSFLPGAKLSVNYYDISFTDRIITPPFDEGALTRPDIYGSLITPLADDAAAAAYAAPYITNGTFIDFFGFGTTGARYVYTIVTQNAAYVDQSGVDIVALYGFDAGESRFDIRLNASVIEEIITAFTTTSTPTDVVNTYGNPLHLRLRGDLAWLWHEWLVNGAVNYSNSYSDTAVVPAGDIDAWTTIDLAVRYSLPARDDALNGIVLGFNVTNLFDEPPPYVNGIGLSGVHYDVGNADPIGRFVSFEIRKAW